MPSRPVMIRVADRSHRQSGFTLVELLIVIVVMGILAAISIIAYNGVTANAHNTKIVAGVRTYLDQIQVYKAQNGYYPSTGPEDNGQTVAVVCLGTGYASSSCGQVSSVTVYQDSVFNDKMTSFLGGVPPAINDQVLPSGPESFVGAVYGNDYTDKNVNGFTVSRTIQYALNGANANCQISGAYSYRLSTSPPVTACEIFLQGITP